ncbi:MAG: hypothetical protein OXG18_12465 [Gemmatimonadetes bacterium]|nr:hypothetical protein [Gemmatimonadota bacterium]
MNAPMSTTSPAAGFRALLRWSSLAVVGSLLAACGGGDPPRVCEGTDAVEVEDPIVLLTGQERLVDYCFIDPEGAKLNVTTATSDEDVGIALVYGQAINLVATGPGTATITITAEDPGGNTASIDFGLEVPNQVPIVAAEWPRVKLLTEQTLELYVDDFFRDPDRDPLFFTASSENPAVATAVLADSLRLVIEALTVGEIMVTITAEDPHGGMAELQGLVRVVEPVLFWRDDFDTNTFDWSFNFATYFSYFYKPGYLSGYNRYSYYFFSGERNEDDNAAEWMVSMSVATDPGTSNQTIGLWSYVLNPPNVRRWLWGTVGHANSYQYIYQAVMPANWQIVFCCRYSWGAGGESDAVNSVGEFNEMDWGVQRGNMQMTVNGTQVFSEEAEGTWPTLHQTSRLFGYSGGGETGQWHYFDWAELWAIDAFDDVGGDWQFEDDASSLTPLPPAEMVEIVGQ